MSAPDSPRLSRNNFDLLRLGFAAMVVLSHCYVLSDAPALRPLALVFSSTLAVQSFFVVSGFLIFMSYERSASLRSYAVKRVRRIYPAYLAIILLCAFGLALASTRPAGEYFDLQWLRYLAANLVFLNFLQSTLPGVFDGNAMHAVNGALWTLKIEVLFYASVPLFAALFRRWSMLPIAAATYLLSVTWGAAMNAVDGPRAALFAELGRQLPGQLCYFMVGAWCYYALPVFERHARWLVPAALAVLGVDIFVPLPWLQPLALGFVVCGFGLFAYAGNLLRFGDFSYGLYIVHFPIIQLLVQSHAFDGRPWLLAATAIVLAFAGAAAMWHGVEKRFLKHRSHRMDGAPLPMASGAVGTGARKPCQPS